jgi:predicted ATP-grasp superfamily ATP-dependent carboligase
VTRASFDQDRDSLRVLILDDGFDRGTIAAARALHEDGWTIGVGSPVRGIAGSSRTCSRWHRLPAPENGVEEYIAAISSAVVSGGYEVVISGDDFGLLTLSEHRAEVPATVPYAAHDVVVRAVDKLELARAAEAVGLATPRTVEATDAAIAETELPVLSKPALHAAPGRVRPIFATTREQLAAHAAEIRRSGGKPLLQEVVDGGLMAYSFVADRDGSIVAALQQQDLHRWPTNVGVSARAHVVPADAELAEGIARLVRELGWFGMAQLQFLHAPGRRPALIDWNARPYGSLPLAIAAGVNLPAIWARLATGRALRPGRPLRADVTFQWFPGDIRASVAERGKARGAFDALRTALGASQSIWRLQDPWPAMRHYSRSGSRALTHLRRAS